MFHFFRIPRRRADRSHSLKPRSSLASSHRSARCNQIRGALHRHCISIYAYYLNIALSTPPRAYSVYRKLFMRPVCDPGLEIYVDDRGRGVTGSSSTSINQLLLSHHSGIQPAMYRKLRIQPAMHRKLCQFHFPPPQPPERTRFRHDLIRRGKDPKISVSGLGNPRLITYKCTCMPLALTTSQRQLSFLLPSTFFYIP